ncbi:restriction endonuclease [Halanaerobium congolense]|jgi:hypothetical protein|uniref:Restriction endonuclease n=1 Tax=Halanaerobium congolense TaxID=54121 RepID=A0A4R7DXK4_9FIRM|nr:restriction endonuclease [Halanaerobium congolense]TDS26637.1 restriction endonuclease [Halanaerobium congolense]SDL01151.1 Restriction endonuclease [Halanaerobium congolense]SDM85247.1 Restriction endonuclease [Halanaerobium congolense]
MRDYQAKGYIFESVIWELLKSFGYVNVKTDNVKGRGASHQIDAFGELAFPTAFMYPIRLICECKCFSKNKIELKHLRSFVGVMKDISENYFVSQSNSNNYSKRYTDVGCFFSATSFSRDSQEYAWAHNISIISFQNNSFLKPLIKNIDKFVEIKKQNNELKNKKKIINDFKESEFHNEISDISATIGILDGFYPIALIGTNNWLPNIDSLTELDNLSEIIVAEKISRDSNEYETFFELAIKEEIITFSVPNIIKNKLIKQIDKANNGDTVFTIDVPYIRKIEGNNIRRLIKIKVQFKTSE